MAMLTKEHTLQIKGAAILCMIGLHLFGCPERLPIECPTWFGSPLTKALQICVPIYLFMSGYGLQCVANKTPVTYQQFILRLKKLYWTYWWIFIPFVSIGLLIGYYQFNLSDYFFTLIGLKWTYNGEWWFFSLYVELLVLYLLIGRIKVKWWHYLVIMSVVLLISRFLNGKFDFWGLNLVKRHFNMIMIDLNIFMMGCFFSLYDIFRKCDELISHLNKFSISIIVLLAIISPIVIRAYVPLIGITELILVPIFCYGIVVICRRFSWGGFCVFGVNIVLISG